MEQQPTKEHWLLPSLLPLSTFFCLLFLGCIAAYRFYYGVEDTNKASSQIAIQIEQLATIFKKIDAACGILDFDNEKNTINFLNVKSFAGTKIGPMTLHYPDRWEGPYLDENPTAQDKPYVILQTHKGCFIVPGDGIKLSNNKTIGRDLILNKDTDIEKLMHDANALLYENQPLVAKITTSKAPSLLQNPLVQRAAETID